LGPVDLELDSERGGQFSYVKIRHRCKSAFSHFYINFSDESLLKQTNEVVHTLRKNYYHKNYYHRLKM